MAKLNPIFLDQVGADLNLPTVLFLTGPTGSGKSTIAREIHLASMGTGNYAFAKPLYEAARAMFFDGDFRTLNTPEMRTCKVIEPDVTLRRFLNDFGDWMKKQYGPQVLGELALNEALTDKITYSYSHYVFDGARLRTDIDPIIKEFGKENCVLLNVVRQGCIEDPYKRDPKLFEACDNETFYNNMNKGEITTSIGTIFKHRPRT